MFLSISIVFVYFNLAPKENSEDTVFLVNKGDNAQIISRNLENEKLIKSYTFFYILSRLSGTGTKMQVGNYLIKNNMSALAIHNMITNGKQILVKATIPEGWTKSKIAFYLEDRGITAKESFLASLKSKDIMSKYQIKGKDLEGFLYPDTYMIPKNYPSDKIVEAFVSNFFKNIKTIYSDYKEIDIKDFYDKIILASIVEREYRIKDEAPKIASVFTNRLKKEMFLGSCATVEYVISEELKKKHPEYLTYKDLEIKSEYNTYINIGLPPAPISNPGYTALKAAFYPEETNFLYFVLKNKETGEHFYSKTLRDHNKAKFLYLKK